MAAVGDRIARLARRSVVEDRVRDGRRGSGARPVLDRRGVEDADEARAAPRAGRVLALVDAGAPLADRAAMEAACPRELPVADLLRVAGIAQVDRAQVG